MIRLLLFLQKQSLERQGPVLLHVAAAADPVMCDGQVKDQAQAAQCIPEVAPEPPRRCAVGLRWL